MKFENQQGDITRVLTHYEATCSKIDFYRNIIKLGTMDPINIDLGGASFDDLSKSTIRIADEQYLFVSSSHDTKRAQQYSTMSPAKIRQRCVELLQNNLIGATVSSYPVYEGDDGNLETTDGIDGTIVVDAATGLIFIFQAGFLFIRLKTIHPVHKADRPFLYDRASRIIYLRADGAVETDPAKIPGIRRVEKLGVRN